MSGFELNLTGPDFASLAARARAADKIIIRDLRRAIRKAGADSVAAVKQEIGNIPSSGKYSTGVRSALAEGTRVSIAVSRPKTAGVTIVTSPSQLPANKRALAKAMNKEWFRHPTYGNRQGWVAQKGHPYFGATITRLYPRMQGQIALAMLDAERAIADSMNQVKGVSGG